MKPKIVRIVATGIAALIAIVAVESVTVAGVFREISPDLALAAAPWDAQAAARGALLGLTGPAAAAPSASIGDQARRAFLRDPLALSAVTTLAVLAVSRGEEAQANRIFSYAERLSRRNVETQMWLIERNVTRNDIAGALSHYNIVLETAPEARPTLYPILMSAIANAPIAAALNHLLRSGPNWRLDFLSSLATSATDGASLAAVSRGALDPAIGQERLVLQAVLDKLVALHRSDLAWILYADAAHPPPTELLRDGHFARADGLAPFDWAYASDGTLNPERRPLEDAGGNGSFALFLPTNAANEGQSAAQLLQLAPGSYALSARVGGIGGNVEQRPYLKLVCADQGGSTLLRVDFPDAPVGGGDLSSRFTIPERCAFQWLSIWVRGNPDPSSGQQPWIGGLALRRS